MKKTVTLLSLIMMPVSFGDVAAQGPSDPQQDASVPTVTMVRVTARPSIDGVLDEEVWQSAAAATDFVQRNPDEGQLATQRTEVRFAVDGEALYIGARMYDAMGGEGVRTRLTRRDQESVGDRLEIELDTFHDHAGRTVFWINPSGVKLDAGQASPNPDSSWDPVWTAETRVDSLGWTAELRIPLSQLRFPQGMDRTWGLQLFRYVERLNEGSMWAFWRKDESGSASRYGHLTDVDLPENVRALEILPYTTGRAAYQIPTQPGSPFQSPREYKLLFGGDVKALLSSSLTLDATINPDFGQVEVDPAVVNLSAFETFLPERRPFFVEGSGVFGFGGVGCIFCDNLSGLSLFYSRRIGRRPQGWLTFPTKYVEVPDNTRILGAAKLTGRTPAGLQMGVLTAMTSSEDARVITPDNEAITREVEPLTNYTVARVKQTARDGNLVIGAIATSTLRRFGYQPLAEILPSRANSVGLDFGVKSKGQAYSLVTQFAASEVVGEPAAMRRLQTSSARYFDRPDRQGGENGLFSNAWDPEARSLRGYGGYARVVKEEGVFQWEAAVNYRSPGFEVNDLAFLTSADYVWMNGNVMAQFTTPTRYYRRLTFITGAEQQVNFDGDLTARNLRVFASTETPGYWNINAFYIHYPQVLDDRMTRGGPVVARPRRAFYAFNLNTDSRRAFSFSFNPTYLSDVTGASRLQLNLNTNLRPAANISISAGPRYQRLSNAVQFVSRFDDPTATHFHGQRTVFGQLTQHTLSMDIRASITLSPTLGIEAFAQPLVSSGKYADFSEFVAPRSTERSRFGVNQLRAVRDDDGRIDSFVLDPDGNAATGDFAFDNPDFNLRSLRGNAVLRWEYRPGSTLYVVWQQTRSGREAFGDLDMRRDLGGIFDARPDNIFMVKATYWLGR